AAWSCPDCGLAATDAADARLGYCGRCRDFTGMCGAGRKIVSPDMMTVTSWHVPCTRLGETAWQIGYGSNLRGTLLCAQHDAEIRAGHAAWAGRAIPVTGPRPPELDSGPEPR
ncbi:MAG: hypothetical protein WAL16_01500, partial [Streptosporangiaceae bacterium]